MLNNIDFWHKLLEYIAHGIGKYCFLLEPLAVSIIRWLLYKKLFTIKL